MTLSRSTLVRATPYLYIAPAVLVMVVALLLPVVEAVNLSFFDWGMGTQWVTAKWVGLRAYGDLLRDEHVWTSLRVTVAFAAIVVTAEMVFGIALALLLERPVRGMALFRTIFMLPMMIAPICVGLTWRYLFDTQYGPINQVFSSLGLEPRIWLADPALAFAAMCVTDIWQWTPFVFIMVLAGLQGLDSSVFEAAHIDGARTWQLVFLVKLPMLWPILMVTLLMRLIDAFRGLEVIFVMTFGGPGLSTELFSLHIFKAAFISQRLGYASALSILLLVVVGTLSLALLALSNPLARKESS
jgi:multiple sugar transport system permease protein